MKERLHGGWVVLLVMIQLFIQFPTAIEVNQPVLLLQLSSDTATVHQDSDVSEIFAKFTFANQTSLNQEAELNASLTSGVFYQYLSPPVRISRKNSTHWSLLFDVESRRGFENDTYTILFSGYYRGLSIDVTFTLIVLYNEDVIPPTIQVTSSDGSPVEHELVMDRNTSLSLDILIKDNREVNYESFWVYELSKDFLPKGSAGESPVNVSTATGYIFTNRTDIYIKNLVLTKDSFAFLGSLERDLTIGLYAVDRAGNKGWYSSNFSVYVDNKEPYLQLYLPDSTVDPDRPVTISWDYLETNSKSPPEFKIELDTDGDSEVDMILEEKYPDTTYTFMMPDNWTVPSHLSETERLLRKHAYEIKLTAGDLYGNVNIVFGAIMVNLSNYLAPVTNINDISTTGGVSKSQLGGSNINTSGEGLETGADSSPWIWGVVVVIGFIFAPFFTSQGKKIGSNRNRPGNYGAKKRRRAQKRMEELKRKKELKRSKK